MVLDAWEHCIWALSGCKVHQQHLFSEAISEQQESLWLAVEVYLFEFAFPVYEQIIISCSSGILDDSVWTHCKLFAILKISNPWFYHSVQLLHTYAYSIKLKHKSKPKNIPLLLMMTKVANILNVSIQLRLSWITTITILKGRLISSVMLKLAWVSDIWCKLCLI